MTQLRIDAPELDEVSFTFDSKPWTVNSERSGSNRGIGGHRGRAELVRTWREAFYFLARVRSGIPKKVRTPRFEWVYIEVRQTTRTATLPDPGACFPAYKAALDGLVDAGVLPDDDGRYVRSLTFYPPVKTGADSLTLTLRGPRAETRTGVVQAQA